MLEGAGPAQFSGGCGFRTQLCVQHHCVERERGLFLDLGVLGGAGRYGDTLCVGGGTCPWKGGDTGALVIFLALDSQAGFLILKTFFP